MIQYEVDCPLITLQHYCCEFSFSAANCFGFMTHRLDSYQPHFPAGSTLQKFL